MFGRNRPPGVVAIQTPGMPMYGLCPQCHTQNTVKWGKVTDCCNCGMKFTVKKATLAQAQHQRLGLGGGCAGGTLSSYEVTR